MVTKKAEVEVVEEKPVALDALKSRNKREDALLNVGVGKTLDELRAAFGGVLVKWDEIEPGFSIERDKEVFVGVPLVIGAFKFNESKKIFKKTEAGTMVPATFVSMLIAAFDEATGQFTTPWIVVNDGSTGIYSQLERHAEKMGNLTETHKLPPIVCPRGFNVSRYPYEDEKGNVTEAATYYIA